MPDFNEPLARRVLAVIDKHPDLHYQGEWRCDSGMCFAGWTAQIAGVQWVNPDMDTFGESFAQVIDPADPNRKVHVKEVAADLLGIGGYDADTLFGGGNTSSDLKRMVDRLADGQHAYNDDDDDYDYEDDDDRY